MRYSCIFNMSRHNKQYNNKVCNYEVYRLKLQGNAGWILGVGIKGKMYIIVYIECIL